MTDPIKVTKDSFGMWHVDFGGGTEQDFADRALALQAAKKVAAAEGRDVQTDED